MKIKKNELLSKLLLSYAPSCVCLLAPLTLMSMQKVVERPLSLSQDQLPEMIFPAQNSLKPPSSSHEGDLLLDDLEKMETKQIGVRTNSPLHNAVLQGKQLEVLLLFDLGGRAYLTEKDNSGDMPLHVAINKGYNDIAALLLQYGAPVNALNGSGQTPLFVAVINRNEELAKTLLAHDAAVDIPDPSGETPLSYAQAKNDIEMCFILESRHLFVELKQTNKSPVRRERTPSAVLVKQVGREASDEPHVDKAPTRNRRTGFRFLLSLFRKKK